MATTGTKSTEEERALEDYIKVMRFKVEADMNAYLEAMNVYRESQLKLESAIIELNKLRDASPSSV